jgi:hypothetical protein
MTALPIAIPAMMPDEFTVATEALLELQVTIPEVFAGLIVAFIDQFPQYLLKELRGLM